MVSIKFNNYYNNNDKDNQQSKEIDIDNCKITNYDPSKKTPSGAGDMTLNVQDGKVEYKRGQSIFNEDVKLNEKKYSVFIKIAAMDQNASNLTQQDLANARKDFDKNKKVWLKLGVTEFRYDPNAGIATIKFGDKELLRIDFVTEKEKKESQSNVPNSEEPKNNRNSTKNEQHENSFERICRWVKQMFDEEPIQNSYPDGVEEVPSYKYKVKGGDRVITIVNENGISIERLIQANAQLDTNKIFLNQIINIPKRYSVENTPVQTKEDVANYSNLSMDYINFLMGFETLHKEPYNDNVGSGTLTVGYGHTNRLLGKYYKNCKAQDLGKRIEINSKNKSQIKLEEEDANQILAQDLINSREDAIAYFGESFLKAPLSIQEAIIDIIFNKGIKKGLEGINDNGNDFDTPTKEIKKYLAEGNYEEVAKHVIYGTQNKGLQKRNIGRVLLACRDLDEKIRKKVLKSCGEDYEKMLAQYGNTAEIIEIKNQWNEYLHPEYSARS